MVRNEARTYLGITVLDERLVLMFSLDLLCGYSKLF
jgi:hypothetical protein